MMKALMGFGALGRDVKEVAGVYQLREGNSPDHALFRPEKDDIGPGNTFSGTLIINNQQVEVARPQIQPNFL
ncbi:MAG: hypothetical protein ABSE95_04410 [Thermodesulfobacteriota bacterium]|jgi:hypothetical protein